MARLLSNMALKGILKSAHSFKIMVVSESIFRQGFNYSTRIGADSDTHEDFLPTQKSASPSAPTRISSDFDTHEDFRPTNNLEASGISVEDVVRKDVSGNPVMIYMKGLPDAPRCGFSALAVKVLQQYGFPIGARDILGDAKLKEAVKAYTNWPTFPQIFIKGEFVGGSDIVLNMHQKGELKELLVDPTPHGKKEEA